MKLTLYRKYLSKKSTIGELYVNGAFDCFTLEDVLRAPGVKIKGQTCIPAGTYEIVLNFSNRFKRIMPLLVSVPRFEGVRIHSGNAPEHTEGCLLPGRTRATDFVGESRAAYERLFQQMAAVAHSEKIMIEILNPTGWEKQFQAPVPPTPISTAQPISQGQTANPGPVPSQGGALWQAPSVPLDTPERPQPSLGQRLGTWVDTMDVSRLVATLSFIATATAGISSTLGELNPKYAVYALAISGTINAFTKKVSGGK